MQRSLPVTAVGIFVCLLVPASVCLVGASDPAVGATGSTRARAHTEATATPTGTGPSTATDTDGDGLLDERERELYETDPEETDTDGDGASDGAEVDEYGTNPTVADTDGDGASDGEEVAAGTDPTRRTDDSAVLTTDGDRTSSTGVRSFNERSRDPLPGMTTVQFTAVFLFGVLGGGSVVYLLTR